MTPDDRPAAPHRTHPFHRPVVVLGAPGSDTAREVARALAARVEAHTLDGDVFAAFPPLQAAARGFDSHRLGLQDAKEVALAVIESTWLDRLGRAADERGIRLVLAPRDAAVQVPFFRAAWPLARFVLVETDPQAGRAALRSTWDTGSDVSEPELPGWTGPAWTATLTPEWRKLAGADLDAIVADQWGRLDAAARADLAKLPEGSWTTVGAEAWQEDPDRELERLGAFLATPAEDAAATPSPFASTSTTSFAEALDALGISVLATTYQSGRLIVLRSLEGRLNTHFRQFPKPMGIAYDRGRLALGTRAEMRRFVNVPGAIERLAEPEPHDALFLARSLHYTGDIRVHDVAWAGPQLWAVNTAFSCLVTFDGDASFVPRWQPPFVTALAPGDRCHLNGLAVVDGRPKYVTMLGASDTPGGWRETKVDGGLVMDVDTNQIVARGLSMPHSPRWYDGRLWVLNSGDGALCTVDPATGELTTVVRLPGFTRGLAFHGRYAFVGLSEIREANLFGGLPLTARLEDRRCGVWIVDIVTGQEVGHVAFDGFVQEMFDIEVLPGIRFPEVLEDQTDAMLSAFVLPAAGR